jgi:hypothetical protein
VYVGILFYKPFTIPTLSDYFQSDKLYREKVIHYKANVYILPEYKRAQCIPSIMYYKDLDLPTHIILTGSPHRQDSDLTINYAPHSLSITPYHRRRSVELSEWDYLIALDELSLKAPRVLSGCRLPIALRSLCIAL